MEPGAFFGEVWDGDVGADDMTSLDFGRRVWGKGVSVGLNGPYNDGS